MPGSGCAQENDSRSGHRSVHEAPAASFQEMLEFLGHWETDQGSWIDPSDLDWLLEPEQEFENEEGK